MRFKTRTNISTWQLPTMVTLLFAGARETKHHQSLGDSYEISRFCFGN